MRKSEAEWTDRQDLVLRQMRADGLPDDAISDRLGRSRGAIHARWKLLQERLTSKVSDLERVTGKVVELERLANTVRKRRINGENRSHATPAVSDIGSFPCSVAVPAKSLDQS